jgi:ribonuclease HI
MAQSNVTIRTFAKLVGKLAATLPGNKYGLLFLKHLERSKAKALQLSNGSYDNSLTITTSIRQELSWWHQHITTVSRPIYVPNPSITIYKDASFQGWGCHCPDTGIRTGGRWTPQEINQDINYLELQAVLFSLQALMSGTSNTHILIKSDNQTTVVGINKQGSTQSANCNRITRTIWFWAIDRDIWLSATHCPGKLNIEADAASHIFNDSTEWKLDPTIFYSICEVFSKPTIDLFASRLNFQLQPYSSWQPDPQAEYVDSFTLDWGLFPLIYAFPPFSLLGRVLQKIALDRAEAIVIVPHWTTQAWFPRLCNLMTTPPVKIKVTNRTLMLPHNPSLVHPLAGRLTLWACRLSGAYTPTKAFLHK